MYLAVNVEQHENCHSVGWGNYCANLTSHVFININTATWSATITSVTCDGSINVHVVVVTNIVCLEAMHKLSNDIQILIFWTVTLRNLVDHRSEDQNMNSYYHDNPTFIKRHV